MSEEAWCTGSLVQISSSNLPLSSVNCLELLVVEVSNRLFSVCPTLNRLLALFETLPKSTKLILIKIAHLSRLMYQRRRQL